VRFGLVHKFLWDRYRSVRQDLYIQGMADAFAASVLEEVVRFHVLCEHELCAEDQSGAPGGGRRGMKGAGRRWGVRFVRALCVWHRVPERSPSPRPLASRLRPTYGASCP
jgi:hypothetical protein